MEAPLSLLVIGAEEDELEGLRVDPVAPDELALQIEQPLHLYCVKSILDYDVIKSNDM